MMETLLEGLAALAGQVAGRSLSPEMWIAVAATVALGSSKLRFLAYSILCGFLLTIVWLTFVVPMLRTARILVEVNVAEFLRQWALNAFTVCLWAFLGRGIIRLIRKYQNKTTSVIFSITVFLSLMALLYFRAGQIFGLETPQANIIVESELTPLAPLKPGRTSLSTRAGLNLTYGYRSNLTGSTAAAADAAIAGDAKDLRSDEQRYLESLFPSSMPGPSEEEIKAARERMLATRARLSAYKAMGPFLLYSTHLRQR